MGTSSLTRHAREGGRTHFIQELERTRDETLKCFSLNRGDLARIRMPRRRELDYSQVPLDISRRVYESVRNAIIYYAGEHYARSGHLEFVHSVDGVRTLQDEFDKVAAHNEHHLSQVRLALA